jgi:hypothetical protein
MLAKRKGAASFSVDGDIVTVSPHKSSINIDIRASFRLETMPQKITQFLKITIYFFTERMYYVFMMINEAWSIKNLLKEKAMEYRLISTKGTRTITGTEAEAIQAAREMERELQLAFGVSVELDGVTVAEVRDGEEI